MAFENAPEDSLLAFAHHALALYKAPFRYENGYVYDAMNEMVADDEGQDILLRVRGWGRIRHMDDPESLRNAIGEIIAQALTEYWNRHSSKTPDVNN